MTHGKEYGRSLSVENIHQLLPLFLAQVIYFESAHEDAEDHVNALEDALDDGALKH